MTKYVLNFGGSTKYPELAKKYFAEIFKNLGSNPRLLVCFFAQPREDWEIRFAEDKSILFNLFPEGVRPTLEMAVPATFKEQIRNSDVVYIHGGDDFLLLYWLEKFDIPKIWEGKVVATSSASSLVLSEHFWTCDWRQNMDGLGILPIRFLAHYESSYGNDDPRGAIDWQKAYKELETYGDISLPIYAPKEGEYIVIEQ